MARARDTLPNVNAIRSLQGSNSEQLEAVRNSLVSGLGNVSRSITILSDTMMSMLSKQHRGLTENFEASQDYYNQSLQAQRQEKTSALDWLSTLFQFQTSGNTKLQRQIISSLEQSERVQAEMFAPMGQALLSMNQKLKDIRGNLLQILRYTILRASTHASGDKAAGGVGGQAVAPAYPQPLNYTGPVSLEEWQQFLVFARESMQKTLKDQVKGTPGLPGSKELIRTFNAMLGRVDDNTEAVTQNTETQRQEAPVKKKERTIWTSISESLSRLDKNITESLVKQLKELGKSLGGLAGGGLGIGLGALAGGLLGGDLGMLLGGALGATPLGAAAAAFTAKSLWKVGSWLFRVHPVLGAMAMAAAGIWWLNDWMQAREEEQVNKNIANPEEKAREAAKKKKQFFGLSTKMDKTELRNSLMAEEILKREGKDWDSASEDERKTAINAAKQIGFGFDPGMQGIKPGLNEENKELLDRVTAAVEQLYLKEELKLLGEKMGKSGTLSGEDERRIQEIEKILGIGRPKSVTPANPPPAPTVQQMSMNQANQPTIVPVMMPSGGNQQTSVAMVDQSTKIQAPIDPSKKSPRSDPFNSYYGSWSTA